MDTKALITAYYDAFNAGRTDEMLTYLADDVEHHVNEGGRLEAPQGAAGPLRP